MVATAPSCCVPSRNQMMLAAGLALKARHVRLWGVPACSRITGPPSIRVSSGGTGGKRRTKSAQDAASGAPCSQQTNTTLAQFTIALPSAAEGASLSPQACSACWLLSHSCCYCLMLYTPLLPKEFASDGGNTRGGKGASLTESLLSILLGMARWETLSITALAGCFLHSS